jgi:trk system potassium uptake protein TrkA
LYIIIAGAGGVGYSLAKALSYKHNVVVVDKDFNKLNKINDDLDVLTIHGDIKHPQTYKTLDIKSSDLYIAVTDSDEANLLSTLVVEDVVDVKSKVVRLKNDGFLSSKVLEKLSINYAVFPNLTTAKKVKALLEFPKANNVKYFHQTDCKLVSIRVDYLENYRYVVGDILDSKVVVVGVERDKSFTIVDNDFLLQKKDLIYLFGEMEYIDKIANMLNNSMPSKINKVVIFGANELSQKIAKELISKGIEIKIVDKNRELCKEALQNLNGEVTVINSSYNDHNLFEEEGLEQADMVISTYFNDEKNIVKCVEAKEHGVAKVVAVNNDKDYYELMHMLDVVVVRGSKAGAYYSILENISSSMIITQRHYCGGKAIMFMRKIYSKSEFIGKSISTLSVKSAVALLLRDKEIINLTSDILLQEGDVITLFGSIDSNEELERWIYEL